MNEQIKRRSNPFDKPLVTEEEQVETPVEKTTQQVQYTSPQPVYEEPYTSYQYQQPQPKQQRRQTKPQYIQPVEAQKDKYTATMDVTLRRKIKVYCAQNGRMFSKFIEEACREKLSREGVK